MNSIEQLRSLKTSTYREIRRFFRIWQQALIPSVITTMLYFVIFGSFHWKQNWIYGWV
jgi:ABC-2 type transport system permease protein